jgi:hypothetical protein
MAGPKRKTLFAMRTLNERPSGRNPEIHPAEPDQAAEMAATKIARRFALTFAVAKVIADHAGLGHREAAR